MEYWTVACAAGALLVSVGLALYSCGLVRAKNAGGVLLRHFAELCITTLGFWAVGMPILMSVFGVAPSFGLGLFSSNRALSPWYEQHLFQALVMALFSSGIVVGALSERSRFFPSLIPSVVLGAIGVPLAMRWVWRPGWLGSRG